MTVDVARDRIAACDEACLMNTMEKQLRKFGYSEEFIHRELNDITDIYRKIKIESRDAPLTFSEYSSLKSIEFTIHSCNCHKQKYGFIDRIQSLFNRFYS